MNEILIHQRSAEEVLSELFPGMDDTEIQYMDGMLSHVDPLTVQTLLEDRYFEDLDLQRLLNKVVCPTLLLYGEFEKGSVIRDRDVEFFHAHAPNATAVQIKDAGHVLQNAQPARVLELIAQWMKN